MAHLAEQELLTPEVCGSNPKIGKKLSVNCNKVKQTWIGPLKTAGDPEKRSEEAGVELTTFQSLVNCADH